MACAEILATIGRIFLCDLRDLRASLLIDCRRCGMADDHRPSGSDLQSLLDKAARLKRRIDFRKTATRTLEKRYETLRDEIASRVPKEADESTASETKGGGTSWNFAATGGATVRVTQPAATLLGKISGELVAKLRKICGRKFAALFVTHYTCAQNFRQVALSQLEKKADALAVIALCEEPAKAQVVIS